MKKPVMSIEQLGHLLALQFGHRMYHSGQFHLSSGVFVWLTQEDPHNAAAWYGAAIAAVRLRGHQVGIDLLKKALMCLAHPLPRELRKPAGEIRYNLGRVYSLDGQTQKAKRQYLRALALDADAAPAWIGLGNVWLDEGRPKRALECYQRALSLEPGNAHADVNRALGVLLLGHLAEGFRAYEERWRTPEHVAEYGRDDIHTPRWDGTTSIEGKRLLVWSEQGYGDTIQMLRYIPALRERCGTLILEVQTAIAPLARATFPGLTIVARREDEIPPHDLQCPTMSLPFLMGTRDDATIPNTVPYLSLPPADLLPETADPYTVGICWAGSRTHPNDRNRSCPFDVWRPLLATPGVRWVSLLYGEREAEAGDFPLLRTDLGDFARHASVIQQCDMVITVDTVVVHLAGALGVPVWMLIPPVPDWRWQLTREDSPWYPTLKIWRQPRAHAWESLLSQVQQALPVALSSLKTRPQPTLAPMP